MTKVLRIINRFNIGGPTYNATFLTRYLSDDFETLLIGGLPEESEADSLYILDEYGVKPMILEEMKRKPSFKSDRQAYLRIKEIIKEFKPDIVHTHASKAGALGRKAAHACRVPIIIHTFHGHVFHSYFGKAKTYVYKTIERNLAKKSTGIVAISEQQKQELSQIHKICSENKIKVIPLGFDLEKFRINLAADKIETRKEYNLAEDEIAIAIVGRLAPIKNHSLFLEVAKNILAKGEKKIRFFIVGDGELKTEISTVANQINNEFGEKIILTSWIKDVNKFNAGMDIICLTSNNEGTPVSLIEAQASNIPVVTTDVGGIRDIVLEGKTGFIVPKGDAKLFEEKLTVLIKNNEIRKEMSLNGWDFVREKFHYLRLVKDMEAYYTELLNRN
ncbi:MAG: glycosyltransferase [Crocinitomicaceae bacterium]|nr:glycosyltransferase [Crocinitomicaceae bacterium]